MKLLWRKVFLKCLAIVLVLPLFFPAPAAAAVNDFTISSFEADYYLQRNEARTSTLRVQEVIKPVFPDFDQNHGILRAIPQTYQGHTLSLEIDSVVKESGEPWNYTTYTQNDNLVLKIGDADKYVHGEQTYIINYRMKNVIAFFDGHDEFYWDINGDQWLQRFDRVIARLHIPDEIAGSLQDRSSCFAGSYGFNERSCAITVMETAEGVTYTATAENLGPRQTLTTVLGFDDGTFEPGPEIAAERLRKQLMLLAAAGSFLLPIMVTGTKLYRRWRRDGKDPSGRGVIIPEYLPPKDLNALTSNVVLNERLESKAVSALIVELAVNKYVHIYEIPKTGLLGKTDYELEVVKDPGALDPDARAGLDMFFSGGVKKGSKIKLSSLKNKLYAKLRKLDNKLTKKLYEAGYFKNDPHKTRKRYLTAGSVMLFLAIMVGFLVVTIPFAVGLGISALMVMAVSNAMPARSAKGVMARDYLYGMRDYMKRAEAERLKVLQSPRGAEKLPKGLDPKSPKSQVKLFEELLPYAMLFGIEKDWAEQFKDLYTQPPDWYSGDWRRFNTVNLALSLSDFSSASTTSFTAPSSSGSSGFSGGSSGGGGGGGGGGGW